MEKEKRQYLAIDLKSFYASVECVDRGLDPFDAHLVVADLTRTEKTICLAVSPALKTYGVPGRARLFEVIEAARRINADRAALAPRRRLVGKSASVAELKAHPERALDYIVAPPRMARYMEVSTQINQIYLRYIAPEDLHVYSVDEVFIDTAAYSKIYGLSARELAIRMVREVFAETGITATVGIGTNLYLAKVAMDIEAKRAPADENGMRIAELDERSYRERLWNHRPLTDFWRVGPGIAKKLEAHGLLTMKNVAQISLIDEDLLYGLFGVNAELLIDHAWGSEPCTIAAIKAYRPQNKSLCTGQVLKTPYPYEKARLIVREMAELLSLDLLDHGLRTDQLVLHVGYDVENLRQPARRAAYHGAVKADHYGRPVPRSAHGSRNLGYFTVSSKRLMEESLALFDEIADPALTVRRITITANHALPETALPRDLPEQIVLVPDEQTAHRAAALAREERECDMQKAILRLKKRFGKNAVVRGMNLEAGATAIERNGQIGGHRA